jgi:hypothetical protein
MVFGLAPQGLSPVPLALACDHLAPRRNIDDEFAELGGVTGALFHCCPYLVLDEAGGLVRMFPHGSAVFF